MATIHSTSEHSSQNATTICQLAQFPGAKPASHSIGTEALAVPAPIPHSHVLGAAWAVTLQLYTRISTVCFELADSKNTAGSSLIISCDVEDDQQLTAIASSLKSHLQNGTRKDDNRGRYHYNTAIVLELDSSTQPRLDEGIQIALQATASNLSISFRHSFMSQREAENLAATFTHILHHVENYAGKTLRDVAIAQQHLDQITAWNSHHLDPIQPTWVVHEQVSARVRQHPEKNAIESWDGAMTYRELDSASSALAGVLRSRGVGPGSWVLYCFHKSRFAVVSVLAILKAGGACVPIDPRHPQGRVRQIVQKTGARHAITGAETTTMLLRSSDAALDIIDARTASSTEQPHTHDWPSLTPDSPAMCLFTSGSTGTPKGIIIPHGHICVATQAYQTRFHVDSRSRILQFASYTFDISVADTFLALFYGGTLCIPSEDERVDGLQEYILRAGANWANLTPTVSRQIDPAAVRPVLRTLCLAGEPVRDSDVEAWVDGGVTLYNVYGPTENTVITTAILARKGSGSNIGYGANTRTWVADMERGMLVPVGAVGELVVESTQLAPGYLGDNEKTRAAFVEKVKFLEDVDIGPAGSARGARRFYRTGDLVRYCEDGSLVYMGRADSQVKLGGQRMELGDIESHLQKISRTRRSTVLLPSEGPLRKKLTAVVSPADPSSESLEVPPSLTSCDPDVVSEAVASLDQSLPSYMVPSVWLAISQTPLTGTGKTDRKTILSLLESLSADDYTRILGTEEDANNADDLSDNQKLLRDSCSTVLNIPASKISLSRSFIAIGGDSITAMQVSFAMKKSSKKMISVKELLSRPSLFDAADHVVSLSSSAVSRSVQQGKRYALSPIQRLFFKTATTREAWNHYHQSMVVRLAQRREPSEVEAALRAVIRRHPMLRARFERQDGGEWVQYVVSAEESPLEIEVIQNMKDSADRERAMLHARQSINIEQGVIVKAQLFTSEGSNPLLFILVHHLVVDLVSWRNMLDEVEVELTTTLSANEESAYEESTPFLVWSDLQQEMARSIAADKALPSNLPLPEPDYSYWNLDASENVYGDVQETRVTLDESISEAVLSTSHHALGTEPIDIFMAAIIISFKRSFPDREVPAVFTEGHGREPWSDDLDISRTVGWFTTMFPLHIGDMNLWDIIQVVRRVKDHRRGTSNKGFDYFTSKYLTEDGKEAFRSHLPSEILFNFEGKYQALEKQHSFLQPEMFQAGETLADQGPKLRRFCLFELAAAVLDNRVHLTAAWNARAGHQARIRLWLTSLLPAAVGEVSAALMYSTPRQLTLSDVELLKLKDYGEVDALTASVLSIPGVGSIDDVEEIYPGSPMQNSLALSQSRSEDGAYEIEMTWEVRLPSEQVVRPEILAAAWKNVVAQHAVLRTVVLEATNSDTNMIHQVVLKTLQPDCIILEADNREDGIKLLEDYPLYKTKGLFSDKKPPHRLLICQTPDQKKTLVRLQVNHIVFDGMSTFSVLQNLSKSYAAVSSSQKLRPLRSMYSDFLRYILDPQRRQSSLKYWKTYLSGAEACYFPTLVDTARASSENSTARRGSQRQQRGQAAVHLRSTAEEIQSTLQRLEVTLPALFQTVWALVLKTYTGGSQSVFGNLASGRDAPIDGIQDAIGPFISMLVCYVDFGSDSDRSVGDIIRKVQRASADSLSNQGVSLAEIQNALELPGSSRLFNSGLTFLPKMATSEMQAKQGWEIVFEEISLSDPTEFDISLIVETGDQSSGDVSLHLDYLESSISGKHAANIASTVDSIVTKLARNPSATVDELVELSEHDWAKISSWNKDLIQPVEDCMFKIFSRRAAEHPEKEAVYSWDGSLSYRELEDLSDILAKHLVSSYGVTVEQMIPVCFEKSLWVLVALLAVNKAGGCFILLDPAQPESRLWTIIDEVEASVMLCSPAANRSRSLRNRAGKQPHKLDVIEVDSTLMQSIPSEDISDIDLSSISVGPDNAVYVVFTSGTTGKPKGAVATHSALATGQYEQADRCGMVAAMPNVRSLQFASYTFDASLGDIFSTIQVGGCICIPKDEDRGPADMAAFMSRARVTYAGLTSSFLSLLKPETIPTLQSLVNGGEALSASNIEAWSHRVKLINAYGPTEATIACIANTQISKTTLAANIGYGYRTTTWIVDPDNHDRLQPIGTIGELLLEGPILCRGYLNQPEQTAKVFINAPHWLQPLRPGSRLYKTGDLVRYDADGALLYFGRKDTQIKINGQRVEIGEIEHALNSSLNLEHEGPVVVDLLKRGKLGESDLLTAFICVGRSTSEKGELIPKGAEARAKMRLLVERFQHPTSAVSSLPQYMIPQAYVPISRLPMTPANKVDRRLLQQVCEQLSRNELVGIGSLTTSASASLSPAADRFASQAERRLAKIWEKVLQVKGATRNSNFFRLGGNSMSALGLRSEARKGGMSILVADIFAHPLLMDMAQRLSGAGEATPGVMSTVVSAMEDVTPSGALTPVTSNSSLSDSGESVAKDQEAVPPFSLLQLGEDEVKEEIKEVASICGVQPSQVQDIFPSTPMQEALMVLAANSESRGAYGMHAPFKLPKDFDEQKFQSAWDAVTAAYPVLRSHVVSRRGRSYVAVTEPSIPIRRVKVSSLEQYLQDQEEDHFEHGSPLCRLSITEDNREGTLYFVFGAHHAIYDGWSFRLVFRAFLGLYRDGTPPPQGPPFQAFAKELCLMGKAEAEQYWKKALTDNDEEGFEFPIYPRSHKPVVKSNYRLDSLPFSAEAASETGVTITTLFHAAWGLTLAQYTASQTVTFGVTLQGRDFPMEDVEDVVGPVIVTVPRQLHIDPSQTVADFVQAVHGITVSSLRYQHLGLHHIQTLGPVARRACDFSSLLVVNNSTGDDFDASMRSVGMEPVQIQAPDFHPYPIVLECFATQKDYNLRVGFDPECIDEPMVTRVMQQFQHNLQSLCRASSASPVTLAAVMADVAPSHVDTILEWTDATRSSVDPTTVPKVHELLERQAREHPSDLAIIGHDTPGLTFADLDKYADALASHIRGLNLTTKEAPFVALCMHNSAAALVCMFAVIKAGAAFMPLNPSQPEARLRALNEKADVKLALVSPDCQGIFQDASYKVIPVDMASIIDTFHQRRDEPSELALTIKSTDVAYLIFTSGTSGNPKGVVMEHGAWATQMLALMEYFKVGPGTRLLQFARYNFDACLLDIYVTLLSGACVCVPSYEDKMNDLEGYILSNEVNSLVLTPTVARMLQPGNLSQVNWITLLGEALSQSDIDAWTSPGRRIINLYGPSETCLAVNARDVKPSTGGLDKLNTCNNVGPAIGAAEWVMNPSQKTALVPVGAVGELLIEGPSLARGYHNDPDRTRQSFPSHILNGLPGQTKRHGTRMYCSGDLVRLVSDGSFEYMGRRDGQVKLRGQRIDLGEIEHHIHNFMANLPGFKSVSVQLYKSKGDDDSQVRVEPYLGALLVMTGVPFTQEVLGVSCESVLMGQGGTNNIELQNRFKDLRRTLRSLLPDYMVPSAFIALERLPLALTGKLDRGFIQTCLHELSQEAMKASQRNSNNANVNQTLSEQENLIRGWWATIIGLDSNAIGPASDFFAIGGNSVSAMRLVGLARSFGCRLRHEDIFTYPMLSDMALHLTKVAPDDKQATETSQSRHFDMITEDEVDSLLGSALSQHVIPRESVQDVFPCTPLQENLMVATSKHPGAYTVFEAMDVPEENLEAVKKAWGTVFNTFDILRTRIILSPERGPLQVVLKKDTMKWQLWHHESGQDDFVAHMCKTTDYGRPLAQLALLDSSEGVRRILFSAHHAVYDAVFLRNMWQRLGHELSLVPRDTIKPVTPFKTYVKHIQDQNKEEATAFWQERLSGISHAPFPPRSLAKKEEAERPPLATKKLSCSLPVEAAKELTKRRLGAAVTVAAVAHAAWALTISHYTANTDTLFGAILSGRDAVADRINDPESIAGPTITTIPYRTVIDYSHSVSTFLAGVQRDAIRAVRHGQVGLGPISRINEDCRQACQFDSLFQVIQSATSGSGKGDSAGPLASLNHQTLDAAQYFPSPLVAEVRLSDDANDVVIDVIYDPIRLQGGLSNRILDTYAAIFANLLQASPDSRLDTVKAVSPDHLSHIKEVGYKPSEDSWVEEYCIHQLVSMQAEREPERPAIESWDGSLTYSKLDSLSSTLAERLVSQGVGPEKSVCLLFEKSKWAIVSMLAVAKAGGSFIPLDPKHPRQRLEFLVESSKPTVILTSSQNLHLSDDLPSKVIVVNETTVVTANGHLKLSVPVRPSNAAYTLYTSGSTGTPKGVTIEHKALCSSTAALARRMRFDTRSRVLQFNSYSFDVALMDIFCTLTRGGCVCVPSEDERLNNLEGAIKRFRADSVIIAPSVSRVIDPEGVPTLKTVCLAGEAILPSDAARWSGRVRLLNGYGPTETCIVSVFGEITPDTPSNTLGESVACRSWVVNPLKLNELAPLGAIGELCTEGANLARGYLGDEAKTAAAFVVDPVWSPEHAQGSHTPRRVYRTGDLVFFNPDGTLAFVGRMGTSQVKIRGQRVELPEIEETIRKHIPSSVGIAVDVFEPPQDEQQARRAVLGAVFGVGHLFPGAALDDSQVTSFMEDLTQRLVPLLTGRLPSYMVPEVYVPLEELPLSISGKLDRRALRKVAAPLVLSLARGEVAKVATELPSTSMEFKMRSAWAKVLGVEDEATVGRWDNFISLGGDSILAMRLIAVLRSLDVFLTVMDVFKCPALADMSMAAHPLNEEADEEVFVDASEDTTTAQTSVHPCTDYQKVFVHGANNYPNAHGVQLIFAMDDKLDEDRLRAAFQHCATHYPTLRTRIIPDATSGILVQSVSPVGTELPWYNVSSDSESYEDFVKEDLNNAPGAHGRPMHRLSVVQLANKKKVLVWHLLHAVYDGWALRLMLEGIKKAYVDLTYDPGHALPFDRFIDKATRQAVTSRPFWKSYLDGVLPQERLFKYPSVPEPRQDRMITHRVAFPPNLLRGGATAANVVIAAWVLVLARLTGSRDVVLAHLITGRTMPVAGIETCPGPTINKVPLRVRLPSAPSAAGSVTPETSIARGRTAQPPTLKEVAALVGAELVRVMPHEQGGLAAMAEFVPAAEASFTTESSSSQGGHAGALIGRLPLDLAVHPHGHLDFTGGEGIGLEQLETRPTAPPPGGLSIECKLHTGGGSDSRKAQIEGVELGILFDSRAVTDEDVKKLASLFETCLAV